MKSRDHPENNMMMSGRKLEAKYTNNGMVFYMDELKMVIMEMRPRPQLYVGERSLIYIFHFLNGYSFGMKKIILILENGSFMISDAIWRQSLWIEHLSTGCI